MTSLNDLIAANDVVIFSWLRCPYCKKVKEFLFAKKIEYKDYLLEQMGVEGESIHAEIKRRHNHETVPAVFIKGQFIGGCDDTLALDKAGKLAPMLLSKL